MTSLLRSRALPGSSKTSLRWAAILASLAVCTACGESDPTQLVVLVESDLDVPAAIDAVVVGVDGPEDCTDECRRTLGLEGPSSLPLSFGIAPRDGDVRRRVRLVVEGRLADTVVVSRTVETGFVPNEVRLLVVRLDGACAEREPCGADLTCDRGECVPEDVDVLGLERIEPGQELQPRDAGPGVDAGDAGVRPDAGDAGAADAGDAGAALPSSCADAGDGAHRIDPDGDGPVEPFDAWCEGGWTLLLKAEGQSSALGYDADWARMTEAAFGAATDEVGDALLSSYWRLPVDRLRFVMIDASSTRRSLEAEIAGIASPRPLVEVMNGPSGPSLRPIDGTWWTLLGAGPFDGSSLACERSTIPARIPQTTPAVRLRLGAIFSEDASCASAQSWVGVGAQVTSSCAAIDATTAGGANLCGGNPPSRRSFPRFTLVYGRD